MNGIESQPDEVATLSAKDIVRIEFQRTPGGKYVGKGGVMNFITRQYDYGGNVYVSADQGCAYQYGDYLGFANYKKRALTLLDVNYKLNINGNQYLNIAGSASYGRNRYSGMLSETEFDDIITESKEHNQSYTGTLVYYYYLKNNGALGGNFNYTRKIYSDKYRGNCDSWQKLNTGFTSALVQWQQTLSPLNQRHIKHFQ